ncbi:hypothetical protein [Microbacterium sp. 18062]|uniref:hypothetical protein n=1 Tax=Microbacterium sp. 18062 TaxID=2681410 RepID=UPI00135A3D50|nr:hypothetical protein [Microbacterium sp. 18062]
MRADTLLAALSGEMIAHWLTEQGKNPTELADDLAGLACSLTLPGPLARGDRTGTGAV